MNFKIFSTLLLIFVLFNITVSWSSTINSLLNPKIISQFGKVLTPVITESIVNGAQLGIDECREVFKWDRWNCPESAFSRQTKQPATREKAFTDAIIAAGIIYSITQDCSRGTIAGCGCDPTLRKEIYENLNSNKLNLIIDTHDSHTLQRDWAWGGCSDDSSFGENLVLKLLEDHEKYNDVQGLINQHNNRIGREIIREKMLKTCKCHGMSGTCSFKTCWLEMPTFSEIAKQLRERYDKSMLISFERVQGALSLGNSARNIPLESTREYLPNSLLYLENSPDFCLSNNSSGWPGVRGRTCLRSNSNTVTTAEKRSCRNLCRSCGYKVRKQQKTVMNSKCNCKFVWCCEVKCDICTQIEEMYVCQ